MLGIELQLIAYDTPADALQALRKQQLDMIAFIIRIFMAPTA